MSQPPPPSIFPQPQFSGRAPPPRPSTGDATEPSKYRIRVDRRSRSTRWFILGAIVGVLAGWYTAQHSIEARAWTADHLRALIR